jgi:hypothetical protein
MKYTEEADGRYTCIDFLCVSPRNSQSPHCIAHRIQNTVFSCAAKTKKHDSGVPVTCEVVAVP